MEVGNRLIFNFKFELKIKEMHVAFLLAFILNSAFVGVSKELFEYRPVAENESGEQRTKIVLSSANHKMKIVTVSRQNLRPTKSHKAKTASLDELMKLAKSSKKKKLELKRKMTIEKDLAGLVGPISQEGLIKKDLKIDQDLINRMNSQHSKQAELSTKLLNKLKRIIGKRDPYFKMCYEKALLVYPKIKGMLEVGLMLNSGAKVQSIKLKGPGSNIPSFKGCMLNQVKGIQFPKEFSGESLKFNLLLQT